jgi:hypothetical protein
MTLVITGINAREVSPYCGTTNVTVFGGNERVAVN